MSRTSRTALQEALKRFLHVTGLPAYSALKDRGFMLEHYNPGGRANTWLVVEGIENGGQAHPFGPEHCTAGEMLRRLDFATLAIELSKREGGR